MATIATDGSLSDVQAKHDAVTTHDGDTLTLPSNVPTSGTWTLTFGGNTTGALLFNATATEVANALNLLPAIASAGGVTVVGSVPYGFRINFLSVGSRTVMTGSSSLLPAINAVCPYISTVGSTVPAVKAIQGVSIGVPWTAELTLTKGIILQGAGIGITIVAMNSATGIHVVDWTMKAGFAHALTGISFNLGARANGGVEFLIVGSNIDGSTMRIHHNKFDINGEFHCYGWKGVIDHNIVDLTRFTSIFHVYHDTFNGGTFSDHTFADATNWGSPITAASDNFIFIEDNVFPNTANSTGGVSDSYSGGRCVMRYNEIHNQPVSTHGTDTGGGRKRGMALYAVYNNDYYDMTQSIRETHGSGVFMWHDNKNHTATGVAVGTGGQIPVRYYRSWAGSSGNFGQCTGEDQWDNNDVTGGPGLDGIYYTGVAVGTPANVVSGFNNTITVSPSLGATDYTGYILRNLNRKVSFPTFYTAPIKSNTSTTIVINSGQLDNRGNMPFANGDVIEIRLVNHGLDEPGWFRGSLISGATQVRPWSAGQNDQVKTPCYIWNNYVWDDSTDTAASTMTVGNSGDTMVSIGTNPAVNDVVTIAPASGVYIDYTYPHPLAGGVSGAQIALSGNMTFGNVVVGDTLQSTLTVSNTASDLSALNVTSVTYPTGFTGATGAFSVAAGATHDITVTFTPVAAMAYSGNITVASNAVNLPSATIPVTGTGVAPASVSTSIAPAILLE